MSVIKISDQSRYSLLNELSDSEMQVQGGCYGYHYDFINFYLGNFSTDNVDVIGINYGIAIGGDVIGFDYGITIGDTEDANFF
jgi:hypothetical protein